MTPFGLHLKYIPLHSDHCLFVLSRDILLYRPVIRSSLTSIAHYPMVYIGMDHEVVYDVHWQQVLEDFGLEEILGSEYSTGRKNALYLMKWTGYSEQSKWTAEPLEHLPRAVV